MISEPGLRLGIDLGGSKIELIAFDAEGRERLRRRVPTPRDDYQATLQAIRDLITQCERELGALGSVRIGRPGSLSRATGRLRNSNTVCLNGQMILQDLEALLRRPVRIADDVNCFSPSEAADGAATGAEVVFGIIIGTGVGAGIVVRGQLFDGPNGIAGEWGHDPLPPAAVIFAKRVFRSRGHAPRQECSRRLQRRARRGVSVVRALSFSGRAVKGRYRYNPSRRPFAAHTA